MAKYIIRLTESELETLQILTGIVGGNPATTRRKHFDVLRILTKEMIGYRNYDHYSGSVQFKNGV